MSWGNQVHSNPNTNQLTEKKHSKRKALYRPLERTEPLSNYYFLKQGGRLKHNLWKEVLRRKRSPAKYQWEQKPIQLQTRSWVEEGLRECHMKNQLKRQELYRVLKTIIKKNWTEEAKATARKSSSQGRKVPLKKNTTTMKKNLVK